MEVLDVVVPYHELGEVTVLREKHGMLRVEGEMRLAEASTNSQYSVSARNGAMNFKLDLTSFFWEQRRISSGKASAWTQRTSLRRASFSSAEVRNPEFLS